MEMVEDDSQGEQASSTGSSKWNFDPNTEYLTLQTTYKPLLQMHTENNAVKERDCAVGERKYVGQVLRSVICSKCFLNVLQKEGKLPPLKNKLWKWCCQPSTTTPCNTTLYFSRNNVVAEGRGLALSLNVEKWSTRSLKRPILKG